MARTCIIADVLVVEVLLCCEWHFTSEEKVTVLRRGLCWGGNIVLCCGWCFAKLCFIPDA